MIETALAKLFTKTGLSDDPDWTDPGVDEPDDDRQHQLEWMLAGPVEAIEQAQKLQLFLTYRTNADVEVAGEADVDILLRLPSSVSAASGGRASWKKIGHIPAHQHDTGIVLDVGGSGTFAVRLSSITAVTAAKVICSVQQWGGT